MSAQALALALLTGLVLGGAAISLAVLWRARTILQSHSRQRAASTAAEAAVDLLQQKLALVERELEQLRRQPSAASLPARPRSGLNLDNRSQVLRMHRRGDSPAEIAGILELPLQEVELLLKVHRIVLRSF